MTIIDNNTTIRDIKISVSDLLAILSRMPGDYILTAEDLAYIVEFRRPPPQKIIASGIPRENSLNE